ncbi:TRAP transporter small permease [Kiloniella laminariae]|uniref:TRAP transporter small permease protein n=1 Tax=Kiloniella laminariae TaxID=454162 RepID=A0ABT4LF70_9PROT|nr:TRAP transporter small permease [Kiloniella laminariae]MCZ4279752.1 TRAP transporter small permease [Kiloniella laminariae]
MNSALQLFMRGIDALSDGAGKIAAWCLFAIGFFITYEVVMRYVFVAPTIWVDEVSRYLMVWVVFLSSAYVLKRQEMITIEVFLAEPSSLGRKLAETLATVMLLIFAGTAVYFGFQIWLKYTLAGHTTDSYLAPPKWLTHAPVWVGGLLFSLQGLVQLIRVWRDELPTPKDNTLEISH